MTLVVVPVTRAQSRRFIREHHRHNGPLPIEVLKVGLADETGELIGVAVAGLPCRELMDGYTLEVTRVCTVGHRNACSMLYGAIVRGAKALGWRRLYTYLSKVTLADGRARVTFRPPFDLASYRRQGSAVEAEHADAESCTARTVSARMSRCRCRSAVICTSVVPEYGVWSMTGPLRTVHCTSEMAVVARLGGQATAPRGVDEPMTTLTAHDRQIGLITPAGGQDAHARSIDEPTHTVIANDRLAVVVQHDEQRRPPGRRAAKTGASTELAEVSPRNAAREGVSRTAGLCERPEGQQSAQGGRRPLGSHLCSTAVVCMSAAALSSDREALIRYLTITVAAATIAVLAHPWRAFAIHLHERRPSAEVVHTAVASAYSAESSGPTNGCDGSPLRDGDLTFASFLVPCGARVRFCVRGSCVVAVRRDSGPYVQGRGFDLNVGIVRALGFPSCAAWGVRTVAWSRA